MGAIYDQLNSAIVHEMPEILGHNNILPLRSDGYRKHVFVMTFRLFNLLRGDNPKNVIHAPGPSPIVSFEEALPGLQMVSKTFIVGGAITLITGDKYLIMRMIDSIWEEKGYDKNSFLIYQDIS